MNEFNTLRSLRSDVPLPSSDDLAPAHARLEQAMAAEASGGAALVGSGAVGSGSRSARPRRKSVKRRLAWIAGSMVGVVGLVFGAGQAAIAYDSSQAASRLHQIAGAAITFDDFEVKPGQYLLSSTEANWGACGERGEAAEYRCAPLHQQIDVYIPANQEDDWVMVRDWGDDEVMAKEGMARYERVSAPEGAFYGKDWVHKFLTDIPTESGEAAYTWITQQVGEDEYRDRLAFDWICDALTNRALPASTRASLLEALAMIPGVTSTPEVANLAGVEGIAFGRNEWLMYGAREEIIIHPHTGHVIGERTVSGPFFGSIEDPSSLTSVTTTVVDSAPSDATPVTGSKPPSASADDEEGQG